MKNKVIDKQASDMKKVKNAIMYKKVVYKPTLSTELSDAMKRIYINGEKK